MEAFYSDDKGALFQGDSLRILQDLPKHYVNSCITSPPYWALRDYHTASWVGGDKNCEHIKDKSKTKIFGNPEFNKNRPSREATKLPGYYYTGVCEICGAVEEDLQLGQEPRFSEYIEKLCTYFDAVYDVLVPEGTLWVNLGDTYFSTTKGSGGKSKKQDSNYGSRFTQKTRIVPELPNKSLCLIPERFAIAMQERGWILRNDIIWHKPNKMPESATDRFTHDYEHLFMFSKHSKYYFEQQLEPYKESSKRRVQSGWNGAVDKGVSWTGISSYLGTDKAKARAEKGRNKRSVWSINTESVKGLNHFAKFPRELIRAPILASTPENGIVLDIFFGSGTTGIVAEELNRKWVGIDISEEYCKMAIGRIKEWRNK